MTASLCAALSLHLLLTCVTLRRPSKIEVWHNNDTGAIGGEDGGDFTEEVGVKLTDLTLVLFAESGDKIELPVRCC
eukprot:COSAG02_NODE_884_length_16193_cov_20.464086_5_plen_76_part_00